MKYVIVTFFAVCLSAQATVRPINADVCPAELTSATLDPEQVIQFIEEQRQVKILVLRENFGLNHVHESIEKRLRRQHEADTAKLEREVTNAYDEAHNASITGQNFVEKRSRYQALRAELDRSDILFQNSLSEKLQIELKQGSYETLVANLYLNAKLVELEGVITSESVLKMKIYDDTTKSFLDRPVTFVDAIMVKLNNGQTAFIPASAVLKVTPNTER